VQAISARFEELGSFAEGRAPFREGRKWGFIDRSGAATVEPLYDTVWRYRGGLARAEQNEQWFYIDTTGAVVWPKGLRPPH